jgi:hypothetical protein
MKYLVNQIVWDLDWDVDKNELDLPPEFLIELNIDSDATELDIEEAIANALSDSTGLCVWQFEYEEVKDSENKSGQNENK